MKFNKWTLGLAALGVVSLTPAVRADETPKPSAVQTALSNTTISGYVSASANVGLTRDYVNSPQANIPFQSTKANGFNLDVVKLTIAKPEDATPWASGYNVDLLFGPDAVNYNSTFGSARADYAIKQAYITVNAPVGNGIDFKVGVFDEPLGYEVFDAGSNPNYTRSYGYAVEPTELTGIMASYKVTDAWSLSGGVANTSSAGINSRNTSEPGSWSTWHKAYFGTSTLTAPTSWGWAAGSQLSAGVIYGSVNSANNFSNLDGNQINYYGGLTLNTPWKQLTGGFAFDYAQNYGGPLGKYGTNNIDISTQWSAYSKDVQVYGLYATYKATDKLSFSGRGEYVELDAYNGNSKYAGSFNLVELTGTVEYDLWANVESRLEVRWDQDLSVRTVGSPATAFLFSGGQRDSVGLYASLIYKF